MLVDHTLEIKFTCDSNFLPKITGQNYSAPKGDNAHPWLSSWNLQATGIQWPAPGAPLQPPVLELLKLLCTVRSVWHSHGWSLKWLLVNDCPVQEYKLRSLSSAQDNLEASPVLQNSPVGSCSSLPSVRLLPELTLLLGLISFLVSLPLFLYQSPSRIFP